MINLESFHPESPLFKGIARNGCRASVIIPLRNEEKSIAGTLDALDAQVEISGSPLDKSTYEVLVLLNNCDDSSPDVIDRWTKAHPKLELHVVECSLPVESAHVGTARRLLMDSAWHRLNALGRDSCGILSTDSDTKVAPDWIAQNLRLLQAGADAVGGLIELLPGSIGLLPEGARASYLKDRRYQSLVAELECILDPLEYDPWPRHLQHFGASLACTPQAYQFAGGLPPVTPLEEVAFVDALSSAEARLRHDPQVVVFTSARLDGRAAVGLSYQLREWQRMHDVNEEHRVPSAAWLAHRITTRSNLRMLHESVNTPTALGVPAKSYSGDSKSSARRVTPSALLRDAAAERMIEETFHGDRTQLIDDAITRLTVDVARLRASLNKDNFML